MAKRALRFGLLGVAALLAAAVVLLPAKTVQLATREVDGLLLRSVTGTLWRGEARVSYRGHDLGRASWRLRPTAALDGALGIAWQLRHAEHQLAGTAHWGAQTAGLVASGAFSGAAANRVFGIYGIRIGGDFAVDAATLRYQREALALRGEVRWSGGRAHYRLSGESYDEPLPPMRAVLSSPGGEPAASVVAQDDGAALIDARLDADGWLHVGVTRRFTVLAGQSFAGEGPADAVVLQVSEQLFGRQP